MERVRGGSWKREREIEGKGRERESGGVLRREQTRPIVPAGD